MTRWLTLLAFALIAVAVFAVRPAQTPGPFLRDFEAYWSAGSAWNAGGDPYDRAIWSIERSVPNVDSSHDEMLPFVGPPATLIFWSLLARLPYVLAARLWVALLAVAALALAAIAVRAANSRFWSSAFPAAIALAVAFGPVTSALALGQVALIASLAAVAVAMPLSVPWRAAAAFVALFQPNAAFGLVSQLGRNRATIAMILGMAATYAAGVAFLGWQWPVLYLRRLLPHDNAEHLSAIQFTPGAIAHGAGMAAPAATAVAIATAIVAVAAIVAMWRRIADPIARFAAIAPLAPFASSFFHEHDLVVAYLAAGWCAVRTRGNVRAVALAATLLVAIDWLGLAQRPTGILQSALLATAAVCAFGALGEEGGWPQIATASSVLAIVFVLAAWLSSGHPVPVWPDALGAFRAAADAPIAAVWRDEQARTGLLGVNPVWAFLRALSLSGCALLSLSVYLQRYDVKRVQ